MPNFEYDYDAEYKRRPVRSTSQRAIERYQDVDPGAGYYTVLSECERGRMLAPGLAAAVLGRGPDYHTLYNTPDDGFVLHRHGLALFACSQHRVNPDILFCVTAIRLGEAQRKVLKGLFEEVAHNDEPTEPADTLAAFRPEIPPLCPIENNGVLVGKLSDKMFVDMCAALLPAAKDRMVRGRADYVNVWLADAVIAEHCAAMDKNMMIRPASGVDKADLKRRFKEAYGYGENELRSHLKKVQQTINGLSKGKVADG
jgi:hypothetical protein